MIAKITDYFKGAWSELIKVTWPNRRQAVRLSALVIVFALFVATFIGAVDWVFSQFIERVIIR